jgi:hypothetical protein
VTAEPVVSPVVSAPAAQAPTPPAAKPEPLTVVIKKDAVIGIRIDQPITTESAHVEDKISAKVSRDVIVDGITAIPAGTRVEGVVTLVERPTMANPRGKLGVRFASIVRPDNTRVAIATDTIYREASDPSSGASFDVSAFSAVVAGGSRVPPVRSDQGPSSGAARPRDAQLPAGAQLTLHLASPLSVTVARDPE